MVRFVNALTANIRERGLMLLLTVAIIASTMIYTERNALRMPHNEGWSIVMDAVIAARDGSLSWGDVLRANDVHRVTVPLITSAVNARLSAWDLMWEIRLGLLLLLASFLLMADVLRRQAPRHFWYGLPLLALLIFSLRQRDNLLWNFTSLQWFYPIFFFTLGAWLFVQLNPTLRALLVVALCAFLASFSSANGLVAWVAFPLFFWLRGYRHWRHYVLWSALTALTVWAYLAGIELERSEVVLESAVRLYRSVTFFISLLGGVFVVAPHETAPIVYLLWLAVWLIPLGVAVWHLWRQKRQETLIFWGLLVMFGLGSVMITTLGRSEGAWLGSQSRTITMPLMAWLGWVGLVFNALLGWRRLQRTWLLWATVAVLGLVGAAQVRTNILVWVNKPVEGFIGHFDNDDSEQCFWGYQLSDNEACVAWITRFWGGDVQRKATYLFEQRLTLYANYDGFNRARATLPAMYLEGDGVVISADSAIGHVMNVEVTESVGAQPLDGRYLYRILAEEVPAVGALVGTASYVSQAPTDADLEVLRQFAALRPRVWYLRAYSDNPAYDAAYRAVLEAQFEPVRIHGGSWNTTVYEDITLYIRKPSPMYTFGDDIALHAWRLNTPYTLQTCQKIQLETLWAVQVPPSDNYSLALVLVDANGEAVRRNDAAPGGYSTAQWEPSVFYNAQDLLDLLCLVPAGDYAILIGLYVPGTGQALPIRTMDGAALGDLLYLTTVTVTE